jgi:hypothetical protein
VRENTFSPEHSPATAVELYGRKILWKAPALHALVGAGTFKLGVLAKPIATCRNFSPAWVFLVN